MLAWLKRRFSGYRAVAPAVPPITSEEVEQGMRDVALANASDEEEARNAVRRTIAAGEAAVDSPGRVH